MRPVDRPRRCRPPLTSSWLALLTAPETTSAPAAAATRGRRARASSMRGVDRCGTVADPRLEVRDLERQIGGLDRRGRDRRPRRGGAESQRRHDHGRGDGDDRERGAEPEVLGEHAADRRAEHDPHRGAGHRRAQAGPAASRVEVGQPRHAARPHDPEGHPEHDPSRQHRRQRRHRLGDAGEAQQRARAQRDAAGADPVGGDPRRHRDRQRGEAGQGQQQRRLRRRQPEGRGHARQQRDDRGLGHARGQKQAVDQPQRHAGGKGADMNTLEKHLQEIVRFSWSVTDDPFCSI